MRGKESDLPYGLDLLDERATAFHDCICFMRQAYPNFGITTYDRTVHRGAEQIVLADPGIGGESRHRLRGVHGRAAADADDEIGSALSRDLPSAETCRQQRIFADLVIYGISDPVFAEDVCDVGESTGFFRRMSSRHDQGVRTELKEL